MGTSEEKPPSVNDYDIHQETFENNDIVIRVGILIPYVRYKSINIGIGVGQQELIMWARHKRPVYKGIMQLLIKPGFHNEWKSKIRKPIDKLIAIII